MTGLIGAGEEVTWRARHFGITHEHCSRITLFNRPTHFRDSMVRGRFKRFEHDHYFDEADGVTVMRDVIVFESPLGAVGNLVDLLFLARYLRRLMERRNRAIKDAAERESGEAKHEHGR